MSHDSINRFLLRERYEAKDLFDTVRDLIDLKGGVLSVDDTVIEKHYSNRECAELIGYFWSGKYHQTIKGLNLITLYYSDRQENSVPINYRIYDKKEGKTKADAKRPSRLRRHEAFRLYPLSEGESTRCEAAKSSQAQMRQSALAGFASEGGCGRTIWAFALPFVARMRCVNLWYEILMQSKHTYFVHFKHLFVWRKCVRPTQFLIKPLA